MVAKSFQNSEILCEPYTLNGRQYVKIATKSGGERQVRWYSDDEYYRMYPDETPENKKLRTLKEVLGFEKGYITLLKIDCDEDYEHLLPASARNNRLFGWFIPSSDDVPLGLPVEITTEILNWDDIAVDDDTLLKEEVVKRVVDGMRFQPSKSQHVGKIGDRIETWVLVKRAMPIDGYYGRTYFHVFEDADGNVFTWNTKTQHLSINKWVALQGTISAHDEYRNEKQTKLVRCKVNEQ